MPQMPEVVNVPHRTIVRHQHPAAGDRINAGITVEADDPPGPGGAPSAYWVRYAGTQHIDTVRFAECGVAADSHVVGLTNEVLLAIVLDRLESYQKGTLACNENIIACNRINQALGALHARTRNRIAQGVEGQFVAHKDTADETEPDRVVVKDGILVVGNVSFTQTDQWGTWSRIEAAVRSLTPGPTAREWSALEAAATGSGGQSGLAEMKQSLARTTKVTPDLPK